jgi:hypothetical protein
MLGPSLPISVLELTPIFYWRDRNAGLQPATVIAASVSALGAVGGRRTRGEHKETKVSSERRGDFFFKETDLESLRYRLFKSVVGFIEGSLFYIHQSIYSHPNKLLPSQLRLATKCTYIVIEDL